MPKRLWNVGMKCPDLEAEVAFRRATEHEIVIEKETVVMEGKEQSPALIRVGDKHPVVAEHWGLEKALPEPLAYGATHMSHSVDDLDAEIDAALAGGATLPHGPDEIEGGFGRRRVACFRSPGGMVFCLFRVIADRVAAVS